MYWELYLRLTTRISRRSNMSRNRLIRSKRGNERTTLCKRRAADLKAAGLNPVLAAGSAAATSSPIALHAPQMDASQIGKNAAEMMSLITMKKDVARTEAETNLLASQNKKAAWDAAVTTSMNNYASDLYPGLTGPEIQGRMAWRS